MKDFDYIIINPTNLIGVDEFNQSFFDKIDQIEIELVNLAVQDNKNEDFISASKRLYDAYLINPDKDENVNYLYFAASSSVNGIRIYKLVVFNLTIDYFINKVFY